MQTCFECGLFAEHLHHVIPRSVGGKKTVPLCVQHHGLVHGIKMKSSALIKNGLAKARANGIRLGRPQKRDDEKIFRLKKMGLSYRAIAVALGISPAAVQRGINELKNHEND